MLSAARFPEPRLETAPCPPTDECLKQSKDTGRTEHFAASETEEVLTSAATQMNLKGIKLSDTSQMQKTHTDCIIPLI